MRIVTAQELESWLTSGKVLEKDARGPKVVALDNGLFLKIFHTRQYPWLARLQPAAKRFERNAHLLKQLGIASPSIEETFWLDPGRGLSGCIYSPLPGIALEQVYSDCPQRFNELLPRLAEFIKHLHGKRVYFRSLHLGNILLLPDERFGLIDFLDMKRNLLPLNAWQIQRNFKHLENYLGRKKLEGFPLRELLKLYEEQH
ncbi:MAG: toluene tolerance protein [Pseudomonas sp.]|uniref:toluene tolerance protein n=1 Tax=Pseudomonas sp. TaxID=306 RepID=UPI00299DE6BD|nr:toluene tolerance protein [Pseudomonas sp.]MDX1722081.1 toluene tolerance protein [Pseudomonas sp.]